MAEIKEVMNPNKLPLIDVTPTKSICPDQDGESTVIIDIPEELEPDLNTTCWIHRVPIKLRQVNEAAYTPQLVSIGPFHHGKPKFKSMEGHKNKYHDQFWERRFCKHIVDKNVSVVEAFMMDGGRIERILRCYAATFELDHVHCLAKVILRDACFIFELFLRNYEAGKETNDYILRTPLLKKSILLDLMLLENQLPFFVFTELFDFILETQPVGIFPRYLSKRELNESSQRHESLLKLVIEFFDNYYVRKEEKGPKKEKEQAPKQEKERHKHGLFTKYVTKSAVQRISSKGIIQRTSENGINDSVTSQEMKRFVKIKHFTDLVRQFLCPEEHKVPEKCTDDSNTFSSCSYSAKKLDRAGVKFEYRTNAYFADIVWEQKKFMSLKVKVPKFTVQDDTECVMRNVMALEQCLYPSKPHICNYIALLDQLIDTAEDVDLLIGKGIAQNLLGSNDAVAKLVNKLCDQIVVQTYCYFGLCDKLNDNYKNWWSISKETFKRVYFKDLWTGSSTVVGFFVTLFSVVSVISTIKSLISG